MGNKPEMPYGQVVVGPPGAGKSTYCQGVQLYYGPDRVCLVNLDPGNEQTTGHYDVDVCELITVERTMTEQRLGPNGALLQCLETIEQRIDWLLERLEPFSGEDRFFVFDCPGQAELFVNHGSLPRILHLLGKRGYRLASVMLQEAAACAQDHRFIAMLMQALQVMLHLDMPHVNLLSKLDLAQVYGEWTHPLSFYCNLDGLSELENDRDPLAKAILELVTDFALLSYTPLAVQDARSMQHVQGEIEKACGRIFHQADPETLPAMAFYHRNDYLDYMQAKYLSHDLNDRDDPDKV